MAIEIKDMQLALQLARPTYARAHDYFGVWAMHEPEFCGLVEWIAKTDLDAHERAYQGDRDMTPEERQKAKQAAQRAALETEARELSELFGFEFVASETGLMVGSNGLAVIPLVGTLMKAQSSFGSGTSTVEARRKVRAAMADPNVVATLFRIDSPGGTVAGTQEFSDDIAKLQAIKPTGSQIEDLGASAAYWPATQTGLIGMNRSGMAGSIGVLNVVHDTSGRANDMKIKVHVIRSGAHKGVGVPGAEVTDEHLAHLRDRADAMHRLFTGAVANGRKMTPDAVNAVADGRVFVGEAAMDAGLVDSIQSMDDTVAQLMERAKPKKQVSVLKGLDEMTEPKAATLSELKAKFPKSSAEWREKQLEAGATLAEASEAFADFLQAQLEARDEQLKDLQDQVATGKKRGVDPFTQDGKGAGAETVANAKEEFARLKAERMEKYKEDPLRAGAEVAKRHPQLHAAYLNAINTKKSARMALADRTEDLEV